MSVREQQIEALLFENHPMGMVLLDDNLKVIKINDALLKLLDLDECTVLGQPFCQFITSEDQTDFYHKVLDLTDQIFDYETGIGSDSSPTTLTSLTVKPLQERDGHPIFLITVRDITLQRQKESNLKATLNHWTQIFRDSPMSIAILDPMNFSIVEANESTAALLGYSQDELLRINPIEISPDTQPDGTSSVNKALDLVQQVFSGKKPSIEWQIFNKQGELLDLEICIDRFTLKGRPVIVTMASDITLRKRQAEHLKESEERFRKLFHNNPLMIFAIDINGTVLSVNHAVKVELGYDPPDLIGKNVEGVFHIEDKPRIREKIQALKKENASHSEWELRKVAREGEIVWVKEILRNIEWPDGRHAYLVTCENITARKTAELARQKVEDRYRSVFDNHLFGLMVIGDNERIVIANPALSLLLGYPQAELVNMHWREITYIEDQEESLKLIISLVRKETSSTLIEKRYVHRDGHLIHVRCKARIIDTAESQAVMIMIQDITDEKALLERDKQLTQTQSQLDHKNRELTSYTMHIAEKNRFLAQLSQELQEILPATSGGIRRRMQRLERNILQQLKNESNWKGFLAHFEEVNPHFLDRLSETYPQLTQKELKHCAYIRMRLSVKDVAAFLHISPKAVEVARYRIKKKIGLESRYEKLDQLLESIK